MRYAYETMLRLFPAPYQNVFAREMADVFTEAACDFRARGVVPYLSFLCNEFAGIVSGAFTVWTGEFVARSRDRVTPSFVISLIAGVAITFFWQAPVYTGVARPARIRLPETPHAPLSLAVPLVLTSGCLFLISVLSLAFVWNMRAIQVRAGKTGTNLDAREGQCSNCEA